MLQQGVYLVQEEEADGVRRVWTSFYLEIEWSDSILHNQERRGSTSNATLARRGKRSFTDIAKANLFSEDDVAAGEDESDTVSFVCSFEGSLAMLIAGREVSTDRQCDLCYSKEYSLLRSFGKRPTACDVCGDGFSLASSGQSRYCKIKGKERKYEQCFSSSLAKRRKTQALSGVLRHRVQRIV